MRLTYAPNRKFRESDFSGFVIFGFHVFYQLHKDMFRYQSYSIVFLGKKSSPYLGHGCAN